MPLVSTIILAVSVIASADTVRVTEQICASCTVSLQPVATLGDEQGDGVLSLQLVISRDARGRYWVGHQGAPGQISIFGPDGRFQRTVGRSGGGPGEFRRIWRFAPLRDGMMVYDDFAKRSTVFDLSFRLQGTRTAAETPYSVMLRPDRSGVMSAVIPRPEVIGFTLHTLDSSGARVDSYAQPNLPYREGFRELFLRVLSPAAETTGFWAARRLEYSFEKCSFGSQSCTTYLRSAPWFSGPDIGLLTRRNMGSDPPHPVLAGVWQADAKTLWTVSWVPDPRWKSAVVPMNAREHRVTDFNRYYDTVIEQIDLSTNRVLATAKMDQVLWGFVGSDQLWYYTESDSSALKVTIVRPVATRR